VFEAICYSCIGKRDNHEDNFYFDGRYLSEFEQNNMVDNRVISLQNNEYSHLKIFAICDGMGGQNGGEVASRICVENIANNYGKLAKCENIETIVNILQGEIDKINHYIYEASLNDIKLRGMGTTLVMVVIFREKFAVLNIGDSRAYWYNGNTLIQLTEDHTEGQRLLDLGLLTVEEVSVFRDRKKLSKYLGYCPAGYVLSADEFFPKMDTGIIMLCSDGVTDFLTDIEIKNIFENTNDLSHIGALMISKATANRNADNATVILLK